MIDIVSKSDSMQRLLLRAERYAQSCATVLIQGESGTGKELLARFIHEKSSRHSRPYIRINCAALNENLVDSALFGHERGAFTGADQRRTGCLEAAEDGTLFLDEIGELPVSVQAKLLRVLEEHEFQRVGSFESLPVRARVVTATNRLLSQEVAQGNFREDLFYRLDALTLSILPLRDRPEEIPALAERFVEECRDEAPHSVNAIAAGAMKVLLAYHWPGNARQLKNVIRRECLVQTSTVIEGFDLPVPGSQAGNAMPVSLPREFETLALKDIERLVIESRLRRCSGNKENAARTLEVTSRTLRNKLALYQSHKEAA
ncbi:MAG: sigma-54-dependent Fis family transcriptional regulator [Fuerstiella sp.]|jgi:two-component system response regulator HydG|nr:sigma-54-dependent Fis family transcriptional regulator [Fuerstiella sp.]MCP4508473.1 sigma-54-dependent Fis family transcriptional regulator [Fuerstiella sp.]MDG2130515.1 sigma-54 dependent transcriptional regulator [Fuerstiella sp.]